MLLLERRDQRQLAARSHPAAGNSTPKVVGAHVLESKHFSFLDAER